jgi:hypothetical protein
MCLAADVHGLVINITASHQQPRQLLHRYVAGAQVLADGGCRAVMAARSTSGITGPATSSPRNCRSDQLNASSNSGMFLYLVRRRTAGHSPAPPTAEHLNGPQHRG